MKTKKNKRTSKTKKGGVFFDPLRKDMTIYVSIDQGFTRAIRLPKTATIDDLLKELKIVTSRKITRISYENNAIYKITGTINFVGSLQHYKGKKLDVSTIDEIETRGDFKNEEFVKFVSPMIKKSQLFVKTLCESSGNCLAFGKRIDEVNKYFENFSNFSLTSGNLKRIGNESANGFIREIKYEKNGYTAYAILKSSKSKYADNLAYEYIVGKQFINPIIKQFPCFLYTYGLFYYKTDDEHKKLDYSYTYDSKLLSNAIQVSTINYDKICPDSKLACILVQHLHNSKTLADMLQENNTVFIMYDLIYILFIVYHALYSLRGIFTHYDLHANNVLLFELPKGTCIEYVYHVDGEMFTFRSRYVPKLIDYGRCYFNTGNMSSNDVKQKICTIPSCNETKPCGYNNGFGYFNELNPIPLLSYKSNQSYDLILLRLVGQYIKPDYLDTPIYKLLSKVTRAQQENLNHEPDKILNIEDAYHALKSFCVGMKEHIYKDYKVEETIHVENGKDMEYE